MGSAVGVSTNDRDIVQRTGGYPLGAFAALTPGGRVLGIVFTFLAWDEQLNFVASQGYRAIAHDRRGHGRSGQAWDGNEMDTYADDLATLIETLDLKDIVLVGHSTGGGEVTRYIGRHGTSRVAKAVLVGAVPPLMLQTAANPGGLPLQAFDTIREGVASDRSQFYKQLPNGRLSSRSGR